MVSRYSVVWHNHVHVCDTSISFAVDWVPRPEVTLCQRLSQWNRYYNSKYIMVLVMEAGKTYPFQECKPVLCIPEQKESSNTWCHSREALPVTSFYWLIFSRGRSWISFNELESSLSFWILSLKTDSNQKLGTGLWLHFYHQHPYYPSLISFDYVFRGAYLLTPKHSSILLDISTFLCRTAQLGCHFDFSLYYDSCAQPASQS